MHPILMFTTVNGKCIKCIFLAEKCAYCSGGYFYIAMLYKRHICRQIT